MQMLGKCVCESIRPICVRREYRTKVTILHSDARYKVCCFYLQELPTNVCLVILSSTVHIKPTHYDETRQVFVVEL